MAKIDSRKTLDNKKIEYEILDDGYDIYLGGNLWITQHAQYGKPIDPNGTYEENCKKQIEQITTVPEPTVSPNDRLRADVDYIALMTGVDLSENVLWHSQQEIYQRNITQYFGQFVVWLLW